MTEIEVLLQRVRGRFLYKAQLEIDGETLYIEIGEAQYHVTWEANVGYHVHQEAVGYQEALSYDLQTQDEVLEVINPPPEPQPRPKPVKLIEDTELDELEAIAKAALPNKWSEHQKWRDKAGYNNAGCPTRFFAIPEHNGNAEVEMMEPVSLHIVAFQPEMALRLIAAVRAGNRG